MTKTIRLKRRKQKQQLETLFSAKPWHIIVFALLLMISMSQTLYLIYQECFPTTIEKNDKYDCFFIGSKVTNTKAMICCEQEPWVNTKDNKLNQSYDTTQCHKTSNITQW